LFDICKAVKCVVPAVTCHQFVTVLLSPTTDYCTPLVTAEITSVV